MGLDFQANRHFVGAACFTTAGMERSEMTALSVQIHFKYALKYGL